MVYADLVAGFQKIVKAIDPKASYGKRNHATGLSYTVWMPTEFNRSSADNDVHESRLISRVTRVCTTHEDTTGAGGPLDPVVDAFHEAFSGGACRGQYFADLDMRLECVVHTWLVEYAPTGAAG